MKILIVDEVRDRASVAAARALARAGWTVGTGSWAPNLASRSSSTSAWHRIPHTSDGVDRFVSAVRRVVREHGYETAAFAWNEAVVAASEHREELGFPIGYGPHEGLLAAVDKKQLEVHAKEVGIAVPESVPATAEAIAHIEGAVIVKPAAVDHGAAVFEDKEEALRRVEEILDAGGQPLVQQVIPGTLSAVSAVVGPFGIVTYAQQVADHIWPQPIGVTARGRTVEVDEDLRRRVERLFESLRWQGIAQLQFLVDADGIPRLIDFNPRYYGSIALAIAAGANHPDAWARVATGRPTTPATARPGVRFQWLTRDLRASLAADRKAELGRWALRTLTASHSLWSLDDPALAPRFLVQQAAGKVGVHSRPTAIDASRTARLHGLSVPSERDQRVFRPRGVPPLPLRVGQRVAMKKGVLAYDRAWLEPTRRELRRRGLNGGPPRFLVRVDEFPYYAGYDNEKYGWEASLRFHEVMAETGMRHLVAVVPQWTHSPLDPRGSGGRALDGRDRELIERMRRDGVAFAQHGTTHRSRFVTPRKRSELSGRSPDDLEALLLQGKKQLAEIGLEPRILVPPFNTFEAAQWPVLSRHYDVVTGGPESVLRMGFQGGPQWRGDAVYLPCYEPLYASAADVLPAARTILEQGVGSWIPIVLHLGWEIDDDYAALRRLGEEIGPYTASWDDFLAAVDDSRDA